MRNPMRRTSMALVFGRELHREDPVLRMLHGFGSDRRLWDGGLAGPVVGGSMARDMASRGHVGEP